MLCEGARPAKDKIGTGQRKHLFSVMNVSNKGPTVLLFEYFAAIWFKVSYPLGSG